jgi:hypothetical protein
MSSIIGGENYSKKSLLKKSYPTVYKYYKSINFKPTLNNVVHPKWLKDKVYADIMKYYVFSLMFF